MMADVLCKRRVICVWTELHHVETSTRTDLSLGRHISNRDIRGQSSSDLEGILRSGLPFVSDESDLKPLWMLSPHRQLKSLVFLQRTIVNKLHQFDFVHKTEDRRQKTNHVQPRRPRTSLKSWTKEN
ncbi:hypothetical protein KIN20_007652 [Parelaphostrongylus tenuis]|uniref:Uncharacterized protein n=1 Tax=Parelaphostrongylus tenuis TaxID=148309 RepID=A0AAD5MLP7_PARTN|nr:hypothetical protein KIN20_007652 [Parelaphostrongylus tenuis]